MQLCRIKTKAIYMLKLWTLTGSLIISILLAGCDNNSSQTQNTNSGRTNNETNHVVCRLKWLYNASFAGEIWALESGLFSAHGLDVELLEGGPEQDAIKDIELGRAQFGIASADQVLRAHEKGASVLVLAQIFQKNPLQWIYFKNKHTIKGPQDLKGLTVGITYGGNDEAIFMALLKKFRITTGELKLYAVHYDYTPFWKNQVDLWPVYRNTQGILLSDKMARHGAEAGFFDPAESGVRFVANSLITSKIFYERHPDIVKKFVEVLLAGWTQAMDPGREREVALAVHQFDRDTDVETIRKQLRSTRSMVVPDNGARIGKIDIMAWQETAQIMYDQNLLKKEVDVSSILAKSPL